MSERTGNRLPVRLTRRGRVVLGGVATAAVLGIGLGMGAFVAGQDSDPAPADCTAVVGAGEDFWTLGEAIGEFVSGQDDGEITSEIRESNPGVGAGELQPGAPIVIPGKYCGIVAEYQIGQ